MLRPVLAFVEGMRGRAARLGGFLLPSALVFAGLVGFAGPGEGQQLPNVGQLQQYQQQYQQQQQQQQQGSQTSGNIQQPQSMVLQPAVPQAQSPLQVSRLEQILSTRANARLQQFGYDQLGRGGQVVIPQTGAVQDDYILGPGDEIVVSLRGQENNEFRATVDRNGQIVLPRLSPISASGRSFGSFREDLQAAVHRAFVATEASVSVGRMRQISVLVSGEVNNPGQRLLTGLSSVVDALILSGGVKKTGSLRAVRIQRGGQSYTTDLYSVLTGSGGNGGMRLADGDRIVVPPLGRTVAVTGLVRRPGIFELASGQSAITVSALLGLAGGQEVRGRYRLSVLRIGVNGDTSMTALEGRAGSVRDSEILFVQLGADQTTSQATLAGGTGLAGSYPVVAGTRLSQLLKAPGALGTSPYTPLGIILRRDATTLMPVLLPFTPVAVLAGREDQPLQSADVIRILSTNEAQLMTFVVHRYLEDLAIRLRTIRNPLSQTNNATQSVANQIVTQSGQDAEISSVDSVPADVQRQSVVALLNTGAPGSALAQQQDEQAKSDQRAIAQAQQQTNGQRIPGSFSQRPVAQNNGPQGQNFVSPDRFNSGIQNQNDGADQAGVDDFGNPIVQRAAPPNFTEQNVSAGSFASNREVQTFGELARQLGIDPLILMNFLVDHRVRLDGALLGPGYYFVGPSATLNDVVRAAGGTVHWADESGVELISTAVDRATGRSLTQRNTLPLRQGMLASYVMRPGDQVRFSRVFSDVGSGLVTIQGEVRFTGTFPVVRGERLSELLTRAGGLTSVAYPYGTVFLRQSVAQVEREGYTRAANEVQNQLVVAMTRVGNDKISPDTFASMQTFVNELRNQQALGRISIAADPSVLASNPAQDPLLEPGDVIYIPQRPSTISVLGQVLQPGSYAYKPGETLKDYIARAGGYSTTADESQTFVVLPDGSARRVERSWLSFSSNSLPPGSAIVVPRDVTPLDLRQTVIDVSQIFAQFAVAIASVAVLSKQ